MTVFYYNFRVWDLDFLLQQEVVEMYRDKVTQILDRLQMKYEEEMEEIRGKIAVSVTGLF